MNTVAAKPMRTRQASLAINCLRRGATDCELFFSADNICNSFRPSADVPENQFAEVTNKPGPFKYQRVPMPVNILGWIQNSTFRLRSGGSLKFVIQTVPVFSGHSLLGY